MENLNPDPIIQVSILKRKIEAVKANRFDVMITAEAAYKIGNQIEGKKLDEQTRKAGIELTLYQSKLDELQKKE